MTGSAMSQIILVVFSPILTRLYTPEEFGILAIYMSIVGLVASAAAGRYEYAILKPKKYYESLSLLILSMGLITGISLLSFIIILIFHNELNLLMNLEKYAYIVLLIPISIFVTASYTVFTMWNNRNKNFNLTTYGNISKSLLISTSQVLLNKISIGLIIGQIFGNSLALFIMSKNFLYKDLKRLKHIEKKHILMVLKKYKDFPIFNMPHMVVTSLKINGTVILISMFFGNIAVGYYSLAMRVLIMPVSIIGTSISQVYYQKISNMYANDIDISTITFKTIKILILIAIPLFTILYFIAPTIFTFVFGKEWSTVGLYVQALTPYMFFMFILSSISSIPLVFNKQKQYLIWGIVEAISQGAYRLLCHRKNRNPPKHQL